MSCRALFVLPSISKVPRRQSFSATKLSTPTSIPNDDDTPFAVPISSDCFQTYELEPPPGTLSVTKNELKRLYYDMWRIRRMELSADRLYKERKVRGFCHLSVGQEAVAVGIENAITRDDKFITAYRCHGNVLMRGATVKQIVGEILGRRNGLNYGKGGSVHKHFKNMFGGNGIVGAQVPVGAGTAFAQQYNNTGNITVNLYGDGAANQGQVFESYNLAKLWNIPVLFGCENNMFGMGTSSARAAALTEYHKRGQYIPGLKINGMDVLAVVSAVKYAKDYMLAGRGPLVYEFNTYRFFGHSVSDPGLTYRKRDDVKKIRDVNDPIANLAVKLLEWSMVEEDELKGIENDAKAEVDEEVAQAEMMPEPEATPQILFEDVYVRGSEPVFARGRTPDENYYYHNTVGED